MLRGLLVASDVDIAFKLALRGSETGHVTVTTARARPAASRGRFQIETNAHFRGTNGIGPAFALAPERERYRP